jgi:hydroxyquinol 1,2-dioxygenase
MPFSRPRGCTAACGETMPAANRSVMRPHHVHIWIHTDGYQPLITQAFLRDDAQIDCNAPLTRKGAQQADFADDEAGIAIGGTTVEETFVTLARLPPTTSTER